MKKLATILLVSLFAFNFINAEEAKKKSTDEYIKDLQSESAEVVITAAQNLGEKKVVEAIDPLIEVIKTHESAKVRIAVASSLGKMGTKGEPTTTLSKVIMKDNDNSVVYASLLAILNLGDVKNEAALEAVKFCEENKSDDIFIKDVVSKLTVAISGEKK